MNNRYESTIPSVPPICGSVWLLKHLHDHTQAEIDALGIEIRHDDKLLAKVKTSNGKGTIKNIIGLRTERVR